MEIHFYKTMNYNIYLHTLRVTLQKNEPHLQTATQGPSVFLSLFSLEIIVSTWIKDSHGLYDYEASEDSYKRDTFYVKNSGKIVRELTRG